MNRHSSSCQMNQMPQLCKGIVNYSLMFSGTAFESIFSVSGAVFKCMAMLLQVSEESKGICLRQ
jgi:hypothetical protein